MNTQVPGMQELLSAGVHFGHQVRRGHPRMKQFIYGARDGVHILDLALSEEKLKEATEKAYEYGRQGKVILVVGTKKQARDIVASLSQEVDTPYLNEKWLGGLLTNFEEIRRNVQKLMTLKDQQAKGELSKYTKKEQLLISRKLAKFQGQLGGVEDMTKMPDVLFVVDAVSNEVAVKEARRMNIPIMGLCDTNANPHWFDYPIPANDDGIKAIKIICETVLRAYGEGKKVGEGETKAAEQKAAAALEAKEKSEEPELDKAVAEEAEALEEVIEKDILKEQERPV